MSMAFCIRLKEARELRGYKSQQSFADAFGVAQSTVGNWEAGKRRPNMEAIKRLASFLGVTVDYLLGLTDENEGPLSEIGEEALDDELISRVKALSPEDRQKVDYFVQGIEAVRGAEASPAAGERKSPL